MSIALNQFVMLNGRIIHYSMEEAIERLDPFGDLAIRVCAPSWQMDVPVPKAAIADDYARRRYRRNLDLPMEREDEE